MDDELTSKTDKELLRAMSINHHQSEEYLRADREWKRGLMKEQQELNRTLMLEQHELNKKLLDKQSKLTKKSITIGFAGIIIGAIIGAVLTVLGPTILSKAMPPAQKVLSEQSFPPTTETVGKATVKQEDVKDSAPPATKEKDDAVSSKSPPRK
jgi:hypothetical protein